MGDNVASIPNRRCPKGSAKGRLTLCCLHGCR